MNNLFYRFLEWIWVGLANFLDKIEMWLPQLDHRSRFSPAGGYWERIKMHWQPYEYELMSHNLWLIFYDWYNFYPLKDWQCRSMQYRWISNTWIQGFVSYMWSFCHFGFLFHQFRLKFSIKWWFLRRGKIQFQHRLWNNIKIQGCVGSCGAKVWLFVGFLCSFGSVIGKFDPFWRPTTLPAI